MILSLIIKALIIQVLFYATYKFILEQYNSFTFNRFFLLAGLLCIAIFPWIEIVIPEYVPMVFQLSNLTDHNTDILLDEHTSIGLTSMASLLVLFIPLIIMTRKLWAVSRLRYKTIGQSQEGYAILSTPMGSTPFSIWPKIFISEDDFTDIEKNDLIIRHEEIHLRKLHTLDIFMAEILSSILWFSPISRLYVRSIKSNHEYEVDRCFIDDNDTLTAYLKLLYKQWARSTPTLASRFDFTTNKNRIHMMTNARIPGKLMISGIMLTVIVPLLLMSFTKKTIIVPYEAEQLSMDAQMKDGSTEKLLDTLPPPPPPPPPAASPAPPAPPAAPHASSQPPIPPPPPPPPAKIRKPTRDMMDRWASEPGTYGVWLDGQRIGNHELKSMDNEDIFFYMSSKLMRNAADYGKYTHHLTLHTEEGFESFRIKTEKTREKLYKELQEWEKEHKKWKKKTKN